MVNIKAFKQVELKVAYYVQLAWNNNQPNQSNRDHSYQIFQILLSGFNAREVFLPSIIAIVILTYMFFMNYIGQCITDDNRQIFTTV